MGKNEKWLVVAMREWVIWISFPYHPVSVVLVGGKLEAARRKNSELDNIVFFSISNTIQSNSEYSRYLRHSSFKSFAYFPPHQLYHYFIAFCSRYTFTPWRGWRHIHPSSSAIHLHVWDWKNHETDGVVGMGRGKIHFKYHNITSYYTFTDMWRNIKKWK